MGSQRALWRFPSCLWTHHFILTPEGGRTRRSPWEELEQVALVSQHIYANNKQIKTSWMHPNHIRTWSISMIRFHGWKRSQSPHPQPLIRLCKTFPERRNIAWEIQMYLSSVTRKHAAWPCVMFPPMLVFKKDLKKESLSSNQTWWKGGYLVSSLKRWKSTSVPSTGLSIVWRFTKATLP